MSDKRIQELEYHIEQLQYAINLARKGGKLSHAINPEPLDSVRSRWKEINGIYNKADEVLRGNNES